VIDTRILKWMRSLRLLVGKNGNGDVSPTTGLVVENLRVDFDFTKTIYRTPNVATIRVYNLTQDHERTIRQEFNDVILEGGYQDDRRLFFRGNIKYTSAYREGNDRVVEIQAGDGDKDFRNALVNFSLAAGHDDEATVRALMRSMQATTLGHVRGKNLRAKHGRGRVFSGSMRDVADLVAAHNDAHWSIQDGKFVMIPVDGVRPEEAVVVSAATGLLGAPEVDDHGITIRMRFDPRVVPGSKLWLQNTDVKTKALKVHLHTSKKGHKEAKLRTDPDGIYKVYSVHGKGDTRGSDWEIECKCVGLDQRIPPVKGTGVSTFATDVEMEQL
jgi:hypothetical protein